MRRPTHQQKAGKNDVVESQHRKGQPVQKLRDGGNGEPSNEVNKTNKSIKRKYKDDRSKKTPIKKVCVDKGQSTAVFQEDQDVVTLQVEQDSEFEDGEIATIPENKGRNELANINASATVTESVNEIERICNAKDLEAERKKADDEEEDCRRNLCTGEGNDGRIWAPTYCIYGERRERSAQKVGWTY